MTDANKTNLGELPYSFEVTLPEGRPTRYLQHITRRLSSMAGQFNDQAAYQVLLREKDQLIYEVFEVTRGEAAGELAHGVSVVHPGLVGDEYHMTKGHFHTVLATAEVYTCLQGEGFLVMETPEGDWAAERLSRGCVVYVPPRWGHRSVNTGLLEPMVTVFAYPANAGHEYGSIEKWGLRKLVVAINGSPHVIDNPRWLPPGRR
jgi:glucose-6-phosphate isomerase, archaeal